MGSFPLLDIPVPWIPTPVLESAALSKAAGCRVYLKLENLQPSGSFKSRGIGNCVRRALLNDPYNDKLHFYSSSGGNAGLACVTAARMLGRPATVVVPMSTKPFMIAKIKTAGAAEVLQYGESLGEADAYLRNVVMKNREGAIYVPPFDHTDVWAGNATIVDELLEKPDAIVCSVGGGGLLIGIQTALERRGWSDVNVLAVETRGADSLNRSLSEKSLVELSRIESIATSLGAKRVAPKAFELGCRKNVTSAVLTDAEAAMGCWRLADDERIMVEPACGVNVAVCYDGRLRKLLPGLTPQSKVVIICCGGSNVSLEMLVRFREQYGSAPSVISTTNDLPSDITAPT